VYGYLVALNSRAKALKPIAAARSRDQHQSIHLAIIRSQMQPSIGDIRR